MRTYYHGNPVHPSKLKNHRLEPTVKISEAPKDWTGKKADWDRWDHFNKRSTLRKGFFVTPSKPHASYFATHWHNAKKGYVYSFPKPKGLKRALGIDDPNDRQFSHRSITPHFVQSVRPKHKRGMAPHAYKTSDFYYGTKQNFKAAVKRTLK